MNVRILLYTALLLGACQIARAEKVTLLELVPSDTEHVEIELTAGQSPLLNVVVKLPRFQQIRSGIETAQSNGVKTITKINEKVVSREPVRFDKPFVGQSVYIICASMGEAVAAAEFLVPQTQ